LEKKEKDKDKERREKKKEKKYNYDVIDRVLYSKGANFILFSSKQSMLESSIGS